MTGHVRYISLLSFIFIAAGCSDPTPAPDLATSQAAQTVGEPGGDLRIPAPEEEQELDEIRWEETEQYREISAERLSEQAQKAVGEAPIPVLLPDDSTLLGSAYLTVGETWYTASMQGEGITVVVNGSGRSREIPGVTTEKEEKIEGAGDHILTRTHGIVTLSFKEFGAAYSIDVECGAPMEDKRCTGDDFVIELAEGAGIVGGKR